MSGPPPPPPPTFKLANTNPPKLNRNQAKDRDALLSDIRSGARLKKAVTNDRSGPLIDGKSRSGGGGGGGPVSSGGRAPLRPPTQSNGNPPGLGGLGSLFADGIPKLKPAGQRGPVSGISQLRNGTEVSSRGERSHEPRQFKERGPPPQPPPSSSKPLASKPVDEPDSRLRNGPQLPSKPPVASKKPMLAPKPNTHNKAPPPPPPAAQLKPSLVPNNIMNGPRSKSGSVDLGRNITRTQSMRNDYRGGAQRSTDDGRPMDMPPPPPLQINKLGTSTLPRQQMRAAPPPPPSGQVNHRQSFSRPSPTPSRPPTHPPPPPPVSAPPAPPHKNPPPPPPIHTKTTALQNQHEPSSTHGAPPPLPVRVSSRSSAQDDFLSRFHSKFRQASDLPPPDPFTNNPKRYPSKSARHKQAAPPPPPYPNHHGMLQLDKKKMFPNPSSAC